MRGAMLTFNEQKRDNLLVMVHMCTIILSLRTGFTKRGFWLSGL